MLVIQLKIYLLTCTNKQVSFHKADLSSSSVRRFEKAKEHCKMLNYLILWDMCYLLYVLYIRLYKVLG